ncbi:hypothetical protein HDF22_001013 [Mucilaginibacter lappiensis]|uniref:Uncharacterized protein n=1 Tax=Mucilaginibacter lappiensis TaxID=354630 RepID=A0A841JE57_9SPHI|nr:hypothetical protein [Mucilaginibacter lappiensis]
MFYTSKPMYNNSRISVCNTVINNEDIKTVILTLIFFIFIIFFILVLTIN